MNGAALAVEPDDFDGRMRAYYGEEDVDAPPLNWTPEHVQKRMVDAFDVLSRAAVGSFGGAGSGWPALLQEMARFVDAAERNPNAPLSEDEREAAEQAWRRNRGRPTDRQLSLMDEALQWPMLYLRTNPMQADALVLFGLGSGDDVSIRETLRLRKKRALAKIAALDQINAATRQRIAAAVAAKTELRFKRAGPGQVARIKAEAHAEFQTACADRNCLPSALKPSDILPGKVLSRTNLDKQRKRATATISAELNRLRVVVR